MKKEEKSARKLYNNPSRLLFTIANGEQLPYSSRKSDDNGVHYYKKTDTGMKFAWSTRRSWKLRIYLGQNLLGRILLGRILLGRIRRGTNSLWDEFCWDELPVGRILLGRILLGRILRRTNLVGTNFVGTNFVGTKNPPVLGIGSILTNKFFFLQKFFCKCFKNNFEQ